MMGSLPNVLRKLLDVLALIDTMEMNEETLLVRKELSVMIRELQHELGYQPVYFED